MSRPASLWFWRDWESDVALKLCSLAAQGLWMRMLCIAAQHDPIGYVSINCVGLDPEGIARIVGVGVDEVRSLIGELSQNGVFSRDRNSTIYNRRMVRDAKKSALARKNGKLGGNPSLSKQRDISASDKGDDNGDDKATLKLKPIPVVGSLDQDPTITPNIEEIERVVRKRVSDGSQIREFEKEFVETFYPGYPLKQAKPKALAAFIKARRKASLAEIMDGVSLYVRTKNPEYAYQQPAAWLNGERWNDQPLIFGKPSLVPKTTVFVRRDTPQWEAWSAWYWKTKNKSAPSDRRGGWDFPTEFPPEILEAAQ